MSCFIDFLGDWQQGVINKAAAAVLSAEAIDFDVQIEVVIADKHQIREINNSWRGIDAATDVLSFPLHEDISAAACDAGEDALFLGSIIICKQVAIEQAEQYGHSAEREAAFLTVHGVLHLLGYDHVRSNEQEQLMLKKQKLIMSELGIKR